MEEGRGMKGMNTKWGNFVKDYYMIEKTDGMHNANQLALNQTDAFLQSHNKQHKW